MISNIMYKLSMFADYSELEYTKANIISILEAFKDDNILPAAIQEVTPTGVSQRIQISSNNGALIATIFSNRIDVQISSQKKEGFSDDEFSNIKGDLPEFLEIINNTFSKFMPDANRLAWFVSYVNFELSPEEKRCFCDRFLKKIAIFEDERTDDLLVRYAARKQVEINSVKETLNIIATVSQWLSNTGTDMEVDGYRIDFDINTYQGNKKNRFETKMLKEFVSVATEIQGQMRKEIMDENAQ